MSFICIPPGSAAVYRVIVYIVVYMAAGLALRKQGQGRGDLSAGSRQCSRRFSAKQPPRSAATGVAAPGGARTGVHGTVALASLSGAGRETKRRSMRAATRVVVG